MFGAVVAATAARARAICAVGRDGAHDEVVDAPTHRHRVLRRCIDRASLHAAAAPVRSRSAHGIVSRRAVRGKPRRRHDHLRLTVRLRRLRRASSRSSPPTSSATSRDLCLKVQIITSAPNSAALVSAGTATTTSTGSAADFLVLAANGSNVTAVATYGNTSDYCIIARPSSRPQGARRAHPRLPLRERGAGSGDAARGRGRSRKVKLVNTPDFDPNQIMQGRARRGGLLPVQRAADAARRAREVQRVHPGAVRRVRHLQRRLLQQRLPRGAPRRGAGLHARGPARLRLLRGARGGVRVDRAGLCATRAGADFSVAHERQVWRLEAASRATTRFPGKGIGVQSQAEWRPELREVERLRAREERACV